MRRDEAASNFTSLRLRPAFFADAGNQQSAPRGSDLAGVLSPDFRGPVDYHTDRSRNLPWRRRLDQKEPAVRRDGVAATDAWHLEQRARDAGLERRRIAPHIDRHQLSVGRDVEQLSAITPPSRPGAAVDRDLPLGA